MTHSGGKPHAVGDKGQRYEVRWEQVDKPGERVMGWALTENGAKQMAEGFALAPYVKRTWVVDRGESYRWRAPQ